MLLAAVVFSLPLGIADAPACRWLSSAGAGRGTGVIQTVPSLALVGVHDSQCPDWGLSATLGGLSRCSSTPCCPFVRNTYTGIREVEPDLVEAARGMGLTERQILTRIQLPLAFRTIMAGVRTATVITIGVATLAAFIGAGGLGEPIVSGLYLNDVGLILSGAVPAAVLALAADFLLARVERALAA